MQFLNVIHTGLVNGRVIPYLGPGVLNLADEPSPLPFAGSVLVTKLTAKASVPHKVRNNLTAAAQFIENFKHRKSGVASMKEAFPPPMAPTVLHRYLASLPRLPLWVHTWYDNLPQQALRDQERSWGMVQGVSQAEHFGEWVHFFDSDGSRRLDLNSASVPSAWPTLLYQPLGSVSPAANFLVSDSDFVEVGPRSTFKRRSLRSFNSCAVVEASYFWAAAFRRSSSASLRNRSLSDPLTDTMQCCRKSRPRTSGDFSTSTIFNASMRHCRRG